MTRSEGWRRERQAPGIKGGAPPELTRLEGWRGALAFHSEAREPGPPRAHAQKIFPNRETGGVARHPALSDRNLLSPPLNAKTRRR